MAEELFVGVTETTPMGNRVANSSQIPPQESALGESLESDATPSLSLCAKITVLE